MMKHLAVLGSSGGNLYNQGGNDPYGMMKEIFNQAGSADTEVSFIQFVGTSGSMDTIKMEAPAKLYTLGSDGKLAESEEKTLGEINELAKTYDAQLAAMIREGKIDGIMLMSCDPKGINKEALTAAAETAVPVAGTGGSSMADTQALGCKVIAASGTTGTTNRTRAVSAMAAFAKEWGIKYRPVIGSSKAGQAAEGNVWKRINIRGIMMASMPGFIAMAICLALSKIPGLSVLEDVFNDLVGILPIIVAAVAAKQISGMDEVGIVAGVVSGAMSVDGGIVGGLAVGILAGIFVYYISRFCFSHRVPGTTTNIAAGGLGGLAAGLIGKFAIAPVALLIGNGIKAAIDWAISFNGAMAGLVAGFAIWFAIMGGVYHAAILPIVLLEMEAQGFSFLGAIDLCGLVMVCAGIQLANIVKPKVKSDRVACIPNIFVNLVFGTFVEAAYPYMFASKKVFAGAIAAATLSGIAVGAMNVKCTAYVPCFVAPFVSNDKIFATILCMVIAMGSAFIFTLLSNIIDMKKEAKPAE
ncbi:MAG: PTS sugar transporter [Lachnospiraceae bacterium]|nr:PTS sugar transporter [Lachnospiraceae bacterium]